MDDTYGFDDNTDLYDPNMDVSIDETDRLIEDMDSVQGNFKDALTKAQKSRCKNLYHFCLIQRLQSV